MSEQQLVCFIDWLGLSVRIADRPKPLPNHVWKEYPSTNVWGKRYVLWTDEGDRVCTLLTTPRSSILDAHAGLLEIENEWLYHGGGPEFILELLLHSVMFEITGISRLDLCVDFCPTEVQRDIILGLSAGQYYVSGKRSGSGFWSTNTCQQLHPWWVGKAIPHCQSWGHKTSDIKWKLYYKTRELWEAGGWKFAHKPYIIDRWQQFGLDESNVWRLEVSCRHLNNLQMYGQTVTLDTISHHRAEFLLGLYENRFAVRRNEGHADKTNDTKIEFLPMPSIGRNINYTPSKTLAEHSGRLTLLRHLVSSLDDEHIYLDQQTRYTVYNAVYQLVSRDNLGNYFKAMTGQWLDDFVSDLEQKVSMEYAERTQVCDGLSIDSKGVDAAEQRLDMPDFRGKYQLTPNEEFDTDAEARRKAEFEAKMQSLYDRFNGHKPPPDPTLFDSLP